MGKLFVLCFTAAIILLTEAFRSIYSPPVSTAVLNQITDQNALNDATTTPNALDAITERKRKFAISCRIPPDYPTALLDVPPLTGWGSHRWKITTTSDSAQFYFDQGINMYYGFHTPESRASFAKAIRFDSTCAMAWYGKALALGPTINFGNGYRPSLEAQEAAQISKRLEAPCTQLEKGLIAAITKRYSPDTTYDLKTLLVNYASAMKELADIHPQNADVITLYADALMLQHPWDLYDAALQPREWTPAIRQVLERALAVNPQHPGANHFMIHTMEGSLHPEDALKSAETLVGLMPGVSHVVHMPSHIFLRTGFYKKGIEVNDSAVDAYRRYLTLFEPVNEGALLYELHAVHMKMTCAMTGGNYTTAIRTSDSIRHLIPSELLITTDATGNYLQYVHASRWFVLLRFGKMSEILREPLPDSTTPYTNVISRMARGIAFARLSLLPEAKEELRLLREGMHAKVLKEPFNPFSSAYEACQVAEGILAGVLAEKQQDNTAAKAAFQRAVEAEDALIYNEPRDWLLPARQYLGNFLLQTGQPREAITVFNRDLQINPKNGWSLTGLKLAHDALQDKAGLQRLDAELTVAWQIRDMAVEKPVY